MSLSAEKLNDRLENREAREDSEECTKIFYIINSILDE